MNYKEYIIPIGEEAKEFDEMFIGVIRKQPELIRCKDCKFWNRHDGTFPDFDGKEWHECKQLYPFTSASGDSAITPSWFYCGYAERKEETMINKATRPDENAPAPAMPTNENEETVAKLRDMIRALGEERDAMEREMRYWYEQAKSYERTILRLVTALTREEEE